MLRSETGIKGAARKDSLPLLSPMDIRRRADRRRVKSFVASVVTCGWTL